MSPPAALRDPDVELSELPLPHSVCLFASMLFAMMIID